MLIENLVGYVLKGNGRAPNQGDKWWPYNANVYVCTSLDKAKELLKQSHVSGGRVWTTVYRVKAQNINCYRFENGIVWTNEPTKLIVDTPVYCAVPHALSGESLLKNARRILPEYSKLMNGLAREENVR